MTDPLGVARAGRRPRSRRAAAPIAATAVVAAIGTGAVIGMCALLAARTLGVEDGTTSPTFAVVGAISAIATAAVGTWLSRSGRSIGRGVSAVGALVTAYLLVSAACAFTVGVSGARGLLAQVLVATSAAWFMVPLTAMQLVVLAMARRHGAPGTRAAALVLVAAGTVAFTTGFAASAPSGAYQQLTAPLSAVDSPVTQAIFAASSIVWMGSVLVPGIVAWLGIRSATATSRHRLALTAVSGILPAWTIALCVGLTPVIFWDASGQSAAADLLAVVFAAPFTLAAIGLALADSASDVWLRRRSPGILVTAFGVAVGGIATVVAAGAGIAIGLTGQGAVIPAIVAAVGIAAASGVVRGRWTATLRTRLEAGPAAVPPAAGLDLLTGRERDVIALLSAGASNAAIAARLSVSERTVDSHVRSIYAKLNLAPDLDANRRVQTAALWLRVSTGPADSRVRPDGSARPRA